MPRRSMKTAASWRQQHAVPLKRVMQEAMQGFAAMHGSGCKEGEALMDPAAIESLLNEVREGKTGCCGCAGEAAQFAV